MKTWSWSLSPKWKSIRPPISVQFSVKLFPFYVDGFEARDGKLVYNELKMSSSHIKFQLTWKFY